MIEDDMSNYDEEGELCLKWLLKINNIILNTNYMFFHLTSSQILSFFHCFINAEIEADDSQELDLKIIILTSCYFFIVFRGMARVNRWICRVCQT